MVRGVPEGGGEVAQYAVVTIMQKTLKAGEGVKWGLLGQVHTASLSLSERPESLRGPETLDSDSGRPEAPLRRSEDNIIISAAWQRVTAG